MPHVGVKRLGAGHAKEYAAKHQKALPAAAHQIIDAVERIDRCEDPRMLNDPAHAERRDDEEPRQHDRAERAANRPRAERLHGKQCEQDHSRGRQNIGRQGRRDLLHAFERGEHRDCRGDRAIAVDERRAEEPHRDDDRPLMRLDAEQRHQGDDAAFAVVVHAHGEVDVFDRGDEEERPENERQGAEHRRRIGMRAGIVEHGLERIERARADVAEHHPERGEGGERQAPVRVCRRLGRLARHIALPRRALAPLAPRHR